LTASKIACHLSKKFSAVWHYRSNYAAALLQFVGQLVWPEVVLVGPEFNGYAVCLFYVKFSGF
jgi:hypothetical protein